MLFKQIYNQRIELKSFVDDVYIEDINGKKYLDLGVGSGINYLYRYGDEKIEPILLNGFRNNLSCTNFFHHQSRESLSNKLKEMTGLETALFVCSGSEGNEAAIKLSLKRHFQMGQEDKNIILYRNGCYFGRTFFPTNCSENKKYYDFLGERRTKFIGFDDTNDILDLGIDFNQISCIVLECFSSRSMKRLSSFDVVLLQKLSNDYDIDLIIDEIKSGLGRTGSFMSYQKFKLKPNIVVGAKSLAAGLPIQAVLVSDKFKDFIYTNWYSSTSGGNPTFCDLALYLMESSGILNRDIDLSNSYNYVIQKELEGILNGEARVIREGDWWNIVSEEVDFGAVVEDLYDNGVVPYYIGKKNFSLLPTRYFTKAHWDEFLPKFDKAWKKRKQ